MDFSYLKGNDANINQLLYSNDQDHQEDENVTFSNTHFK